jgi:hypothetical protein
MEPAAKRERARRAVLPVGLDRRNWQRRRASRKIGLHCEYNLDGFELYDHGRKF